MTPWPADVTLKGRYAELRPLTLDDAPTLAEAVRDGELWKLWYTMAPSPDEMPAAIQSRLDLRAKGAMLPFVVLKAGVQTPVGMTTFMNIDAQTPRVEIGGTWYQRSVQRTPLNTECKLLLLGHAFEALSCVAVEFRTHFFNAQSRRAIERLGAKLDGVLRNHTLSRDGLLRDTCVYSILASEWPTVRRHLEFQLERFA